MIVTYHSPFAQAVIGKEVGEHFTLDIEGKDTKFTVKSIEVVSPSKKKIFFIIIKIRISYVKFTHQWRTFHDHINYFAIIIGFVAIKI